MKQTITKVGVLCFLGLGAVAYAQQGGKVGINTITPQATLDIRANAENLKDGATSNEGLIIPQLTKARVIAIAKPVEGTQVYVTDEVLATDTQFVGTGKGFYHYNGTKWAKQTDAIGNSDLWAERPSADNLKETYLVSSSMKTGEGFFYKNSGEGQVMMAGATGASHMEPSGFFARRYHTNGYGPALKLTASRGTAANPAITQAGDNLGRIVTAPTLSLTEDSGWASSINTFITDIESPKSYASNLVLGARSLGKQTPNLTVFIQGKTNRVGIHTDTPEASLHINGDLKVDREVKVMKQSNFEALVNLNGTGNLASPLNIINKSKTSANNFTRWTIYNVTNTDPNTEGGYHDGLVFWGYNQDSTSPSGPKLFISDEGNVGIGGAGVYANLAKLTERLEVVGNIKSTTLAGAGDRPVVADANGVLKVATAGATTVGNTAAITCDATNVGKINYGDIRFTDNGAQKTAGAFGFCTKKSDGTFAWAYIVGGANVFSGAGEFGTGL